ncbi:apolipoprotein N-acyltransferase [Mesoaciditoga sp.]
MQKRIRHFGIFKRIALVELSAFLLAISMPGMISNVFVWMGLIPFFFSVREMKWWSSILYGWMLGITFVGISLYWLLPTLMINISVFNGFPSYLGALAFFVSLPIEGFFWAIFGLAAFLVSKSKAPWIIKALSVSSAYTLVEYIRGIGDIGFTGARLSNALYSQIGIIQLTSFFGTLGLVFMVVFANYSFYHSLNKKRGWLFVVLSFTTFFLYTTFLLVPQSSHGKVVNVAVVQPNVSVAQRYEMSENEILNDVLNSIKKAHGYADLVVFPEGTFEYNLSKGTLFSLANLLKKYNMAAVIGFPFFSNGKVYNAVALFNSDGMKDVYFKHILVPFTEKLPYPRIFGLFKFLKLSKFFTPGEKYTLFKWDDLTFSTQICFESYFGRLSRKFTNEGANFLVTVTNDSWFGQKTALEQHFAQSVFRAVENRKWTIQVADTGITGFVDEYGRVQKELPIHKKVESVFSIKANRVKTFYDRFGNWINWVSILFLLLNVVYDIEKKREE